MLAQHPGGPEDKTVPAFSTIPTIDGRYEIIDNGTGRPIGIAPDWEAAHGSANLLSGILNVSGPKALAKAITGMRF